VAINPRARFHDGSPITARDVEFTFQKFMTEGVPQFRLVYKGTCFKRFKGDIIIEVIIVANGVEIPASTVYR
ncbi:hypothetical protein INR35_26295, partial [Escherichia coli]|nr:hypothetical protein [Escherichia coli]